LKPAVVTAVLVIAAGFALPSPSTAKTHCVDGSATQARLAGSDAGPPKFTATFFVRAMSIDASTDGVDQDTLPISIETICGLPTSLDKQAAQLVGGDGVALITTRTSVWKGSQKLPASQKLLELGGADTVTLRGRLLVQRSWKQDQDGNSLPTFTASRVTITD
jgi:hypothetical protein